jgi:hypothetical protein
VKPKPSEPSKPHVQGGLPCWCGYQGMGILAEKAPRFAPRTDGLGYGRGRQ